MHGLNQSATRNTFSSLSKEKVESVEISNPYFKT